MQHLVHVENKRAGVCSIRLMLKLNRFRQHLVNVETKQV